MKNVALIIGLALLTYSCSKDEENNNETNTNPDVNQEVNTYPEDISTAYEYLHSSSDKKWLSNDFNLSTIGSQVCRLDDEITFFSDKRYAYSNGNVKCGGDVDNQEGSYRIDFDNKKIVFDEGTNEERIADIVSLSDDRIVVTGGWSVYQIKATFKTE